MINEVILPKVLILETIIPKDLINELNDYMDHVLQDTGKLQMYLDKTNPAVKKYLEIKYNLAENYIKKFSEMADINYIERQFETQDIWAIYQFAGGYNPLHAHTIPQGGSGLASICWTKVPKQILKDNVEDKILYEKLGVVKDFKLEGITDGQLQFVTDQSTTTEEMDRFKFPGSTLVKPTLGKLLIFPLHLNHIVYPFKGEGERRTIASNISCTKKTKEYSHSLIRGDDKIL
tara:strand:+ start:720 stop:1418 length:699 start_codon:yes stop_codon:yes gene_type:complete